MAHEDCNCKPKANERARGLDKDQSLERPGKDHLPEKPDKDDHSSGKSDHSSGKSDHSSGKSDEDRGCFMSALRAVSYYLFCLFLCHSDSTTSTKKK